MLIAISNLRRTLQTGQEGQLNGQRSFTFLSADIVLPLYKCFLWHYLENNAAVWSGNLAKPQIDAIEKLQMRAIAMIEGFKHLEYSARLEKLKLPSLVY